MKIFISHSSKDKFFGEALVELLRDVGVKVEEIIFTSNTVYGIPLGQNIFNWLKSQITEKPFVVYLLSQDYYKSIACLNEMGAAWIIENKYVAIFVPNFDLKSENFNNGALDPRELGFYISNEDRILSFLDLLATDFEISKNITLISQCVKKFLKKIEKHEKENNIKDELIEIPEIPIQNFSEHQIINQTIETDLSRFINLVTTKKLKDEELLMLHYIIDMGRHKLMTGWQEKDEVDNIKLWELNNELDNQLSRNYNSILNRFKMIGLLEVSSYTSGGNAKELKIKDEISSQLIDLPEIVMDLVRESVEKSHSAYLENQRHEKSAEFHKIDVWRYIYKFTNILANNFPKNESGIVHTKNLKRIDNLFQSLKDNEELFDNQLWWQNGSSSCPFKLTKKGDGIWLLNQKEINIEEIWIHYDSSFYNDFILVHFRKGVPFIVNGIEQYHNIFVDDTYEITYSEYENNFAEINDEIIDLSTHKVELIEREKKEGFLILSTKFHCALRKENDDCISQFFDKLKLMNGKLALDEFKEFETEIRKHIHIDVLMDL